MGCDCQRQSGSPPEGYFNPRTPCGVRPGCRAWQAPGHQNFNPRTPCGVRPGRDASNLLHRGISIHAPRVGCDVGFTSNKLCNLDFNPRTPCGVRRYPNRAVHQVIRDFNPRTPCGVRHNHGKLFTVATKFQSTHPVWGATPIPWVYEMDCKISIHAPRVGCDGNSIFYRAEALDFNPRTPCGVRLDTIFIALLEVDISIHAPRVGCDTRHSTHHFSHRPFQSTHPVWGATAATRRWES